MTWAPQKRWKDKSYWVHVTSPQQIHETDHARFREAVDGSCKRAGYSINSSFMMKPLSVGIVMATVADAKRLIEATSITLDCEPPSNSLPPHFDRSTLHGLSNLSSAGSAHMTVHSIATLTNTLHLATPATVNLSSIPVVWWTKISIVS